MRVIQFIMTISYFMCIGNCDVKPLIGGGSRAKIKDFPYAAFLACACKQKNKDEDTSWICGSSIVNQRLMLTAAHCVIGCDGRIFMYISVGHKHRDKGTASMVHSFHTHGKYCHSMLNNDIALMRLKTPLSLNSKVSRVAIMKSPPYDEDAYIAGWGLVDEQKVIGTRQLIYAQQNIWKPQKCRWLFKSMPKGTLCGGSRNKSVIVTEGDSGSALVVRGYIQIGIVSYKTPEKSGNVIVYTNVSYYYKWIQKTANTLCKY